MKCPICGSGNFIGRCPICWPKEPAIHNPLPDILRENTMTTFEDCINNLKEYAYEFATKAAPIYQFLGWSWAGKGIPNRDMIAECVMELINMLSAETKTVGTGGIVVKVYEQYDEWVGEIILEAVTEIV